MKASKKLNKILQDSSVFDEDQIQEACSSEQTKELTADEIKAFVLCCEKMEKGEIEFTLTMKPSKELKDLMNRQFNNIGMLITIQDLLQNISTIVDNAKSIPGNTLDSAQKQLKGEIRAAIKESDIPKLISKAVSSKNFELWILRILVYLTPLFMLLCRIMK